MSKLRFTPLILVLYDKIILFIVHNFSGSHRMRFFHPIFNRFYFQPIPFRQKSHHSIAQVEKKS